MSFCSDEAGALIQEIYDRLASYLNLRYGPKTMTINRRPSGKLMKIIPALNCIQITDPAVKDRLHELVQGPVRQIEGSSIYRDAVISPLAHVLERQNALPGTAF